MKRIPPSILGVAAVLASTLPGPASAQTGFPFQNESLRYSVNWPSGLSLGDATMTASHSESGWSFSIVLSAGVPGFPITDKLRSTVTNDLCSLELDRDISHSNKKTHEKTTFDQKKGTAHRQTVFPEGGGKSDMDIPACARDAVAFVYYTRRELGQGRVPPQSQIFFGSSYSARMEYTGAMNINVAGKPTVTDHLVTYVKGPRSEFSVEVFYARDAARTPLLIRIPLSVGTLSAELVR